MKLRFYSHVRFSLALGIGAIVALVLCVQCVRTYLYTGAVLVPQQAERVHLEQGRTGRIGPRSEQFRLLGSISDHVIGPAEAREKEQTGR
jgi:hypothetical protein